MIRKFLLVLLLVAVSGCNRDRGDASGWKIDMDPRLAALQAFSYACMLDVTGLAATNTLPPPNVRGVDEPWGNGAFGEYYSASRSIQVQITRPYNHLVNILAHENGHDGDRRVNGKNTGEDYANWVDSQCREKNMPDIYPAPPIDWEAE